MQTPQGQPIVQQTPFTFPQGVPQQAPYAQPQAQNPASMTPMAPMAPVAGVPSPGYTAPQGQPNPAQQAQQAFAKQMQGIARSLEQVIPGYQVMVSVLQDLANSPKAQELGASQPLMDTLRDATFQHFAALGAIRRALCGETTQEVATALAYSINRLAQLHSQARPLFERLVMAAMPDLRPTLSSLVQTVTAADAQLTQALSAAQATVGPQTWEAAKTQVFGADQV